MRAIVLLALAAALAGAQEPEFRVERVATGFHYLEGPAWSKNGYLIFSDIPNDKIYKFTPGKVPELLRDKSGGANGNALDERGRLITCEGNNRRVTRMSPNGEVEVLVDRFEGKRLNSPNDVAVRHDGHIYFTDPAFGKAEDTRELPFYGVYHITPKGEMSVVARMEKRPNGVALSPNGRILYVAGADERVIRAYDLDRQGNAAGERIVVSGIEGVPHGIRTNTKGDLFVACSQVAVYTPEGKPLGQIELNELPSNLAFGDNDNQTLYVTARTTLYRVRLNLKGSAQPE